MPRIPIFLTTGGICLLAGMLCVVIGCLRTDDPGPIDNKTLSLLVAGRMDRPCLGKPHDHLLFDLTDQQAKSLVRALNPIRSARAGGLAPEAVDYTLSFQPGMDPVVLRVHLGIGDLTFAERQYIYEGGDAKEFKQLADAVMATNPGKPGIIADAEMDNRGEQLPGSPDRRRRDNAWR